MENQSKVNIGIVLAMIIGFTTVVVLDDNGTELDPTHYCESRELKMYCNRLSGTEVTCYPTELNSGYKRCSEGWKEIPKETYSKQTGKQWKCNQDGCIEIKNSQI